MTTQQTGSASFDTAQRQLARIVDASPMSPMQILVVLICFVLNMNDGIDVLIVSYVAPVLSDEWALAANRLGWIFSAGLFGMMIGCLFIAPFADVLGRKRLLLASLVVNLVGVLGSASSNTLLQLIAARVLVGAGIGGVLPTIAAMAAEYSNEKRRDLSVGFVQAGWPIGAIGTGFFAAWALPQLGWRALFLFGGGVTALMIVLVAVLMPESLAFLVKHQPKDAIERIGGILARMGHPPLAELPPRPALTGKSVPIGRLFTKGLAASTILLWTGLFLSFLTLYTMFSWVPTIASDAGMPIEMAIYVGMSLSLGGFFGSTMIGWLSNWFGLKKVILAFMVIAFCVMVSYGFLTMSVGLMFVVIFLIGLTVQGGFNGFYPATARVYSAELRATGIGWAMGAGRTGAIFGPLLAGYMLDAGVSQGALFVVFSIPVVLSGICAFLVPSKDLR